MAVDLDGDIEKFVRQAAQKESDLNGLRNVEPQVTVAWTMWDLLRRRGWMIAVVAAFGLGLVAIPSLRSYAAESFALPEAEQSWPLLPQLSLGLCGGLLLGLGLAVVMDVRDQAFRDSEDICSTLELPILAHIPQIEPSLKRSVLTAGATRLAPALVSYHHPSNVVSQRIRSLGSRISSMSAHGDGIIVQFTSANLGEGKTITLANLAISLALENHRVLVVDADFDSASLHAHFGLDSCDGFSEVIESMVEPKDAIHDCAEIPGLHVLPAGRHPELAQQRNYAPLLAMMLKEVREEFDCILVDCPPILNAPDASCIASMCDATVMVIKPTRISRVSACAAVTSLRLNEAKIVGVVLNHLHNKHFHDRQVSKPLDGYETVNSDAEMREPSNVAVG